VKGPVGVFDVRIDGDLVFSKHSTDRFPEPGEIEKLLERRLRHD
jgi:selT/selW/selH-like putative selenoprotein